jgi:hypothetical protein
MKIRYLSSIQKRSFTKECYQANKTPTLLEFADLKNSISPQ